MIDTHVNYHAEAFDPDRSAVLERARQHGLTGFIAICDRVDALSRIAALVADIPDMWHSVGVHPHHAKDFAGLDAGDLGDFAARHDAGLCALGETGLDYYKNYSPRSGQIECFTAHIEAAQFLDLPVIIHCRDAENDMARILEHHMAKECFTPLLHCYTGSARLAQHAAEMGAYFSVSGIVTFGNAQDVRRVVADLPPERIVIETDSPYLAPRPHRGQRNEPSYLPLVCAAVAELLGLSLAETVALTSANARRLFPKAFAPRETEHTCQHA